MYEKMAEYIPKSAHPERSDEGTESKEKEKIEQNPSPSTTALRAYALDEREKGH
jgi:hypothetical protein